MGSLLNSQRNRRVLSLYVVVSLFLHVGFYIGNVLMGDMYHDARDVWLPIARGLANGEMLYITVSDNKPPLFFYINSMVYSTGHYAEVFYILLMLANTSIAILLWRWLSRNGKFQAGVLAGGFYLVCLPLVNGLVINVRSLAMVFVVLAVLTPVAWHRGALLAAGTLISQYTVFAIPVLLWDGITTSESQSPLRWAGVYVLTGLLTGVVLYLPLFFIWGPASFIGGIESSFLSAGGYALEHTDQYNPYLYPFQWLENLVLKIYQLSFILVPAGVTTIAMVRGRLDRRPPFILALLLALAFSVTLAIRSLYYYWIPVLTFTSVIAAYGVDHWFSRR